LCAAPYFFSISRVTVCSASSGASEGNSAQIVIGYKREEYTTFTANLTHRLRICDGSLRLERKVIRLINAADSLDALGFLL
jgi:hypothetical protein